MSNGASGAERAPKIYSLHYIRALASLLVVYAHFFAVGLNDAVTPGIYVPAIKGTPIAELHRATGLSYIEPEMYLAALGINSGHLGVMLFFLVSGFVICMSLERQPPMLFLARRFLRLFPVAVAAVLFAAVLVYIYCALKGVEFSYSIMQTIYSALLVSGWVGYAGVIPVLWTLSSEIMFYAIMAVVAAWLGPKFGYRGIVSAVLGCLVIVYGGLVLSTSVSNWPALAVFARFTSFNAVYVIFMLAGAAVSKGFSDRKAKHSWALTDCALTVAVLLAIFALGVLLFEHYYPRAIQTDVWTGVFSFLVFIVCLVLGGGLKDWKIPSFFADISYPLYLVHLPLAWIVLHEVTKRDISLHIAVPAAFAAIVAVSWLLHVAIEKPFQTLGQRVGRKPTDAIPVLGERTEAPAGTPA